MKVNVVENDEIIHSFDKRRINELWWAFFYFLLFSFNHSFLFEAPNDDKFVPGSTVGLVLNKSRWNK